MNRWRRTFKQHHVLISNFNYLSVLQIFQLLLPLITYPYLIRVLGTEIYGVVAFANAVVIYLNVFIEFGFNISEIRELSVNRNNAQKVSSIVSSVLFIKSLLAILTAGILMLLVLWIPKFQQHQWLYIASLILLMDTAINPRFYFQAIEKMKFITVLNLSARLFLLLMLFVVVRQPKDYILVPLLTGLGAFLSSIIGLIIIFRSYKVRFVLPGWSQISSTMRNSLPFFGSRISVLAIHKTNTILIGAFLGYSQVAYYDLAEKLVSVMKMPFNVFNQVLFPNVSKTKNISLVFKTLKLLLLVYVPGYLLLYLLGEPVVNLLAGSELLPALPILYILGISVLTELVSVFLGAPVLLAMGYKKAYNFSIIWGSIFYVLMVLSLYLSGFMNLYTLTVATVVTSAFIMTYRIYYCHQYKLF